MGEKEYGLMIIWNKAREYENRIIDDVKKRFLIRNIFEIEWDKEMFSSNLTRFYGQNLPKNSFKEVHCGTGPFLLLILEDNNPIYSYRPTSHGKLKVNVNFYDSKEMYRKFAGQHRIHATNDITEFKHDLMLLLGLTTKDYEEKYNPSDEIISLKQNVIGSNGWKNINEIFYVLNKTIKYVVLRNYEFLPNEYILGEHSDIDLLCDSQENIIKILNAKPYYKNEKRAKYIVEVSNSYINFDLRYIGDNYYDKKWEESILNNRIRYSGFYVPCNIDKNYSLIYHALIQKQKIANDYREKLNLFEKVDYEKRIDELNKYMKNNNYRFVIPKDYSVYFNEKYTGVKDKILRKLYFRFYKFIRALERRYR